MVIKICKTCKKEKNNYRKDKTHNDGFSSMCTDCKKEWEYNRKDKKIVSNKVNWRNYYESCKQKVSEYHKKYREENKEKRKEWLSVYQVRRRGNGGNFTKQQWYSLLEKYNYHCACCGLKKELTVDHVIPVSKGGVSDIENIQPLCRSCNSRKGTRIEDYRHK